MKVMLVDDDREFIDELAVLLTHAGYEVETFIDGATAFNAVQRMKPAVIILDLKMDMISGYKLASHLKKFKDTVTIPIIGMSGYAADSEQCRIAAACGMNAFLQKPFPPVDLITVIEQLTGVPPVGQAGMAAAGAGNAVECKEPDFIPALKMRGLR